MEFSACFCGEKRTMAGMAAFYQNFNKEGE
jgi:hypothetical protein